MRVIQPSLFLIMKRFPDCRNALRQKYRTSESFQSLCQNYQKCTVALGHWVKSEHEEAPSRQREYSELKEELELEIIQSLEERF
jgi:hypothetical protein